MATMDAVTPALSLDQSMLVWKEVSWRDLLVQMNEFMASSKEQREQSTLARKNLAESSKQLRKYAKACEGTDAGLELAKECKATVKLYQEEIDNLTRRCKNSEQSYQSIAFMFLDLPDPVDVMVQLQEQMTKQKIEMTSLQAQVLQLQEQNKKLETDNKTLTTELQATGLLKKKKDEEHEELIKLRKEVAQYEVELCSLKNQDITVRKLEAKIEELQTAGAEMIQSSIEQAKAELAITEGRRTAEALEREAAAELRIQALELQLSVERAGFSALQNKILDADDGIQNLELTWDAQRQILIDDNNRIREELQLLTRTNNELLMKLALVGGAGGSTAQSFSGTTVAGVGSGGDNGNSSGSPSFLSPPVSGGVTRHDLLLERTAYEAEVSELSETNALLREELRLRDDTLAQVKLESQHRVETFEREISVLNSTIQMLEEKLAVAPSQSLVESMKRELRILKRLEYNADEENNPETTSDAQYNTEDHGAGFGSDNLESLLVAKLRRAESELVTERTSKTELQQAIEKLKGELDQAVIIQNDANKLIASLEKDLERAIAATALAKSDSHKSSVNITNQNDLVTIPLSNPQTLQNILDSSTPTPADPSTALSTVAPGREDLTGGVATSSDHSVASIVMAQLDRLRSRTKVLEAERDAFKRELQAQVQMSESLRLDNTKLYEKVRYLQNYNAGASGSGGNVLSKSMYHRSGKDNFRDLDLEALEQRYEASVDPFKQFNKIERQRKLNEMSSMERTVYIVAKTVLATKEMRTALFFYVVTLHLLVFFTTYRWSHSGDECNHFQFHMEALAHQPPELPTHIQEQIIAKDAVLNTTMP